MMHQLDDDVERREHWPKDAQFFQRLERHFIMEENREKEENRKFAEGEKRMANIEEELKPLKHMYWAVIGSGAVGTFLLMSLLFIYSNDRANAAMMQDAIYKQGIAIEKLIQSHQELEKDYRRDMTRIEKEVETYHGKPHYPKP